MLRAQREGGAVKGFISLEGKPSLVGWMRERDGITPVLLLDLFKHTSCRYRKEYEAAMEYCRRKYRAEMELREAALLGCPFLKEEVPGTGDHGHNKNKETA